MNVKGLLWLGTRTSNFNAMVNLYRNIRGLELTHQQPGFFVMDLPNGDPIDVFGDDSPYNTFFTNLVEDIPSARGDMVAQGIEFIGPAEFAEDGNHWAQFSAPDGFIFELTYSPVTLSINNSFQKEV